MTNTFSSFSYSKMCAVGQHALMHCVMKLLPFLGLEGVHKKSIRANAEVIGNLPKAEKTPLSHIQRDLEGYNFSDNPTITERIGVSTFEFIYL